MYPEADIPCVQLSLVKTLDPAQHIEIGKALHNLVHDNILLIGSGFSFHNLKAFFQAGTPETTDLNHAFEAWLMDTCRNADYSEEERTQMLVDWADAPGARYCHPREEHLLPIHVCYGLAQAPCSKSFELEIMGKKCCMYLW
jgi:aromatic ring-opening dioxygenase catalytic subunit (LigB family)